MGLRKDLLDSDVFRNGVTVGLCLYQDKVVTAHGRKEPLIVGDELFYLQTGRERLAEMLDKVCR